jgi:hypothetical protein
VKCADKASFTVTEDANERSDVSGRGGRRGREEVSGSARRGERVREER